MSTKEKKQQKKSALPLGHSNSNNLFTEHLIDFLFDIPHPPFQNMLFNKSETLFIITRTCSFLD